jgi:hypothetical protein
MLVLPHDSFVQLEIKKRYDTSLTYRKKKEYVEVLISVSQDFGTGKLSVLHYFCKYFYLTISRVLGIS